MSLTELPSQLTPRESYMLEYEKEQEKRQMEYGAAMRDKDIELAKMEAKWSAWLRLPTIIIKLPLLLILGIAYIVHAIRGIEPSDNFWNLLK